MPARLGELLVARKSVSPDQVQAALASQRVNGGRLGLNLVELGFATREEVGALLSRQYGVPSISLSRFDIDARVIDLVPADLARAHQIVPIDRSGPVLVVAAADPTSSRALEEVARVTGCTVKPVVAAEAEMLGALARYYEGTAPRAPAAGRIDSRADGTSRAEGEPSARGEAFPREAREAVTSETPGDEAPVVRFVNVILASAIQQGASDIHVEPYENDLRIRFRVDGVLRHALAPPAAMREAIASRIKVMAKLDIAERRLPQDGRIRIRSGESGAEREIDLRVSCLPTLFGEKIVLRLLDRTHLALDLSRLGFEPEALARFEKSIRRPWGMVLVTGPTGSGKTSTLYSSISRINTPATNILTAEDPVEFNLAGVNQVQIRESIGLTFAAALRAFLRQDPDVILVGEIRDAATAEIAIKAALTGHLVLSTLHTNDAPSTVIRLVDMGMEPFLVAGAVTLICAQRLVRRICAGCSEPDAPPASALDDVGFDEAEAAAIAPRRGRGCDACNATGYRGRVGLYEVMDVTDSVRSLILAGAPVGELRAGRRAARPGRRGGHGHAAPERAAEDRRGRHHGGRGRAGDRSLGTDRWPRPCRSSSYGLPSAAVRTCILLRTRLRTSGSTASSSARRTSSRSRRRGRASSCTAC